MTTTTQTTKARKDVIAEVAAAKKPEAPKRHSEPKIAVKVDEISVSDVARELKIDPKRARARLRTAGKESTEGRWAKFKRGSKAHQELVEFLRPEE